MGKFINPFTDWGFKHIFGRDISKDLLIDFLNGLFAGKMRITNLNFCNTEQIPETNDDRNVVFDLFCTTDDGEKIIVEMQNRPQTYFIDRAVFYTSRAISNQGSVGEWDYHLTPVITICFMNFVTFGKEKDNGESRGRKKEYDAPFRVDMILADEKTGKRLSDKMHFTFLQLPVFQKEEDECENDFERWIYILNNMETFQRMPFLAQNAVFRKLAEISDISTLSKEEHKKYDESIKRYRDTMAVINYAAKEGEAKGEAKGHAKGLAEGRAEGRAEGLAEGLAKGEAKGEVKGKAKVALKLLKLGISIENIAASTDFTEEELAKLFNMNGTQPLA